MQCVYYAAGRCRSCTMIERPYPVQLAVKQRHLVETLRLHAGPDGAGIEWLPPLTSPEQGFRNKAKMVVTGTVEQPILGTLAPVEFNDQQGIDLRDCGLYTPGIHAALPVLAEFVSRAALTPYDIVCRSGELKNLLVTESPDGELMVRFVLRSQESVARIRKHLAWLLDRLPGLRVVSVNLLPEHKAVVEGDREIVLTEQDTLTMRLNGLAMHLRPQSFFQTNTDVAAALYRQARQWVDECAPTTVWDLYCGVGGFALHCSGATRTVVGVETSAEAVASARSSAAQAALTGVDFRVGDATDFALGSAMPPDLVIVNPPRRGLGEALCRWLAESSVQHVIYSSCNAESLARDLAAMPSLRVRRVQLLDMFPQTAHYEVLTLLER